MMALETYSDLPIATPFEETGISVGSLRLQEYTDSTLLHVYGTEAETVLQHSAMKIGDVVALSGEGMLARLRRDEFLLLASDGRVSLKLLAPKIGDRHVTVTDITHGRCAFHLVGVDAASVLRKVCGLDFSDAAFPVNHAAQTSLAKVRTLIIRYDYGARQFYALIVDRSLGQYVWDVVADAMQEFA